MNQRQWLWVDAESHVERSAKTKITKTLKLHLANQSCFTIGNGCLGMGSGLLETEVGVPATLELDALSRWKKLKMFEIENAEPGLFTAEDIVACWRKRARFTGKSSIQGYWQ